MDDVFWQQMLIFNCHEEVECPKVMDATLEGQMLFCLLCFGSIDVKN